MDKQTIQEAAEKWAKWYANEGSFQEWLKLPTSPFGQEGKFAACLRHAKSGFLAGSSHSMEEDWVSVYDKLPKCGVFVEVKHTHNSSSGIAWIDYQNVWYSINKLGQPEEFNDVFNYDYEESPITHWRPVKLSINQQSLNNKEGI